MTAGLTQPVISCVTSSQMLLNSSELPCLLISCGSQEEVYFQEEKKTKRYIFKKEKKQTQNSNETKTRLAQGPAEEHLINRNINM